MAKVILEFDGELDANDLLGINNLLANDMEFNTRYISLSRVEPEVKVNFAERPKIITIIGSTRFINEMSIIGWEFEKQGCIVLNPRLLPIGYANETHLAEKENVKEVIDKTYLHKIEMADEIFVVNIGGYIGDSTKNELRHAIKLNKKIVWLEPESKISA